MRPLRHGYTNRTVGDGAVVEKTYEGPGAGLRLRREHAVLTRLRGRLPVPPVQGTTEAVLTLGFVNGVPGQELLAAGRPEAVLASCGELLRRIHGTAPGVILSPRRSLRTAASRRSWRVAGRRSAGRSCPVASSTLSAPDCRHAHAVLHAHRTTVIGEVHTHA
ncbi:phosphotransferase, partial [Streptomyces sp. NPDC048845]|uniref:phosphotransferase n=1 Tax=Streptomyces sp. NPDC048845 TaxID=3155390 RepID=UPI003416BDAB